MSGLVKFGMFTAVILLTVSVQDGVTQRELGENNYNL